MFVIVLTIVLVLLIACYLYLRSLGGITFPWLQFYVRGKESGFSFREVNLLRTIAIKNRLNNPTALFWSVKVLDRCIRSTIVSLRATGNDNDRKHLVFVNKLFDFRKRVELDQPKYTLGLTSTRSVTPGQTCKIALEGGGVYFSKVLENNRRYIAMTYPRGNPLPPGFSWRDQPLRFYFWRQEDAGYSFESRVIGNFIDRKIPIIHVQHADDLVRVQKRRSVRRDLNVPAQLYPLRSIGDANEVLESSAGFRCRLLDISEDGAAVAIGGRVKAGVPLKIIAEIADQMIVLSGVIQSTNYQRKHNISVLHTQAKRPSDSMKVKILTFVYQLFDPNKDTTAIAASRAAAPVGGGGA